MTGVPFVLVGNKLDLGCTVQPGDVKAKWLDTDRAHAHFQTSALTNLNVELVFQ